MVVVLSTLVLVDCQCRPLTQLTPTHPCARVESKKSEIAKAEKEMQDATELVSQERVGGHATITELTVKVLVLFRWSRWRWK